MVETLLVEIFTEELPPKALKELATQFALQVRDGLFRGGLLTSGSSPGNAIATPRRLAVLISNVLAKAPDRAEVRKLMPAKVAFDVDGKPSTALLKRLEKEAVTPEAAANLLERRSENGTEQVFLNLMIPGVTLNQGLQAALTAAIEKLPIPKRMRYQTEDGVPVEFVRPAHGLVALHGHEVVRVSVLGLTAGRITHGHRFQGAADIALSHPDEYMAKLEKEGKVLADFTRRRTAIEGQLVSEARRLDADPRLEERQQLLDEVTALVENPTVYVGEFEREFLEVPQECLILTMQQNQKYFPLFDQAGKLLNKFLIVSNMQLDNPKNIVDGNQRVIRPRLADARFFYEQDKKLRLADRVSQLAHVVYHNKLGTQLSRVGRLQRLASNIAEKFGVNVALADRAALLCKTDLLTNMVGEFPELQGIMGRYYAGHDGEDPLVAETIEAHYRPRFAGDVLPPAGISTALALAERLDTLVGIFGVGQIPSGDKDPFGLRRAALGILRILIEGRLALDLAELLELSSAQFPNKLLAPDTTTSVYEFVLERLRNYLLVERGFEFEVVDAVISQNPTRIDLVLPRAEAVRAFRKLPEAESLSAANKRTRNILKKANGSHSVCKPELLADAAERQLHASLVKLTPEVSSRVEAQDYTGALKQLASIRGDVDKFFDDVMVMADDPAIRANRLALLAQLEKLMNQVADISKLAA